MAPRIGPVAKGNRKPEKSVPVRNLNFGTLCNHLGKLCRILRATVTPAEMVGIDKRRLEFRHRSGCGLCIPGLRRKRARTSL